MDAESQASECTSHTHSALTVYIFLVGEVITSHKSILFRTTSNDIGEKASQIVPERPVLHGCNLKFSAVSYKAQSTIRSQPNFLQLLGKSGMFQNNGLKTVSDGFRFHDQCRDWEAKAI